MNENKEFISGMLTKWLRVLIINLSFAPAHIQFHNRITAAQSLVDCAAIFDILLRMLSDSPA